MPTITNSLCNNTSSGDIELIVGSGGTINIGNTSAVNTVTLGSTNSTSTTKLQSGSGGIKITGFAQGVLVTDVSGVVSTVTGNNGYVLTSNEVSEAPQFLPLPNILVWDNVTGTDSATMVANHGYIDNGTGTPTIYTLPATAAIGDIVAITGVTATHWRISQHTGQTIYFNSGITTTGTSGYVQSTNPYDCIQLQCIAVNTDWVAIQIVGNLYTN